MKLRVTRSRSDDHEPFRPETIKGGLLSRGFSEYLSQLITDAVHADLSERAPDGVVTTAQISESIRFHIERLTLADPFHPLGSIAAPTDLLLDPFFPLPEPDDPVIAEEEDPLVINGETIPAGNMLIVWLNAFIPRTLVGLTKTVSGGQFKGSTQLPGPMAVNDCFLTDNRAFSARRSASSRIHTIAAFDVSGRAPVMVYGRRADTTFELDCEDGDIECQAGSDVARVLWRNLAGTSDYFKVDVTAQANNPCFTASPDIEFNGTVRIVNQSTVMFEGVIGEFPAFEAYAQKGNGPRRRLFQETRKRGAAPMSLFNGATRRVMVSVNL